MLILAVSKDHPLIIAWKRLLLQSTVTGLCMSSVAAQMLHYWHGPNRASHPKNEEDEEEDEEEEEQDVLFPVLTALRAADVMKPSCHWRYSHNGLQLSGELTFARHQWTVFGENDPFPLDFWRHSFPRTVTVDLAGFSFTLSSDSRGGWYSLPELGLQLEETAAQLVATACAAAPAQFTGNRADKIAAELQCLVNLPCLQHYQELLLKTPAEVLIIVQRQCPLLLNDVALLLSAPLGQLHKTVKTATERNAELEILLVLAMMARSARRVCSALPDLLGMWLRNEGASQKLQIGLNRFGVCCSIDRVRYLLATNGSRPEEAEVVRHVRLWFGILQVDNWDHSLAVYNLTKQKEITEVHGSILTAYQFQNLHVAKGLSFTEPSVPWNELSCDYAKHSAEEARLWRQHFHHLIEKGLKLYSSEKDLTSYWTGGQLFPPVQDTPTPLGPSKTTVLEIDPYLGFKRTADFVTLCHKGDKVFAPVALLEVLLKPVVAALQAAAPDSSEFLERYGQAALDLCLLKWRALMGGDGALNSGLNGADYVTKSDPLSPVQSHAVSFGWLHAQQAAYETALQYCEVLMRRLHLSLEAGGRSYFLPKDPHKLKLNIAEDTFEWIAYGLLQRLAMSLGLLKPESLAKEKRRHLVNFLLMYLEDDLFRQWYHTAAPPGLSGKRCVELFSQTGADIGQIPLDPTAPPEPSSGDWLTDTLSSLCYLLLVLITCRDGIEQNHRDLLSAAQLTLAKYFNVTGHSNKATEITQVATPNSPVANPPALNLPSWTGRAARSQQQCSPSRGWRLYWRRPLLRNSSQTHEAFAWLFGPLPGSAASPFAVSCFLSSQLYRPSRGCLRLGRHLPRPGVLQTLQAFKRYCCSWPD